PALCGGEGIFPRGPACVTPLHRTQRNRRTKNCCGSMRRAAPDRVGKQERERGHNLGEEIGASLARVAGPWVFWRMEECLSHQRRRDPRAATDQRAAPSVDAPACGRDRESPERMQGGVGRGPVVACLKIGQWPRAKDGKVSARSSAAGEEQKRDGCGALHGLLDFRNVIVLLKVFACFES